jgi:hypothetical protein
VFPLQQDLLQIRSYVYAEEPNIDIHNFLGTFTRVSGAESSLGCAALTVPEAANCCVYLRFLTKAQPALKADSGFSVGTAQLECVVSGSGSELEF